MAAKAAGAPGGGGSQCARVARRSPPLVLGRVQHCTGRL